MSDQENYNTATLTPIVPPAAPDVTSETPEMPVKEQPTKIIDEGQLKIVKNDTDIKIANQKYTFYFWAPVYLSLQAAVNKLTEGAILAMLNSTVLAKARTKARSVLPVHEDKDVENRAIIAQHEKNSLLLSEEDAINFIPGLREPTTKLGWVKAFDAAMAEGDKDEARRCARKIMECLANDDIDLTIE